MKAIQTLLIILFWCEVFGQSSPQSSLEKDFLHPPVSARPKALWPWINGNVNLSQITLELEEAKRKGMGGFDIWDIGVSVDPDKVIPAGPAFLSDQSVQAIAHTIREADRLNMEIGLTFSSSWNAGGSWVKPEHGAMGLFHSDTIIRGPQEFFSVLPFPHIPEKYGGRSNLSAQHRNPQTGLPAYFKEIAILAYPFQADSTINSIDKIIIYPGIENTAGNIKWKVPEGKWRISRYVCAPTGQPLAIPSTNSNGLMLDHFSADAQKANLQYIFDKLLPATGSLKNRSLKYLYGDSYEVNSAVWTSLLAEEFEKRNDYSLIKYLPLLTGFRLQDKDVERRFKFDFTKTLSDLIIENHYQLARKICAQHGLGFCAEAGGPGQPIHNVPFEDLKALGALTIPRGEFWNKHPQLELLQIVKGIASASHIYNQKYVEAESFTSVWLWQEGPDELKPLADRAMCEGLNRFVYHTFPHTPPESGNPGWVYNFGTLINTTNGWWPKSDGFHHYLARCSYLLQQGNFRGDVAFYYGDRAPNFVPPKNIPSSLGFGYDYDVVNSDVILNEMQARNGRIYLPHGQYYEVLILPDDGSINPSVLKKIEQLIKDGAIVIGRKPSQAYSLTNREVNDKFVHDLARQIWGNVDSLNVRERVYGKGKIIWGKTVKDVLTQKGIGKDVQFQSTSAADTLDFIHRSTGQEEIYFIRNVKNTPFHGVVQCRVKDMLPELWDPVTGEIIHVPVFSSNGQGVQLALTLESYGSAFIVFRKRYTKTTTHALSFNDREINGKHSNQPSIIYSPQGLVTTTSGNWKWKENEQSFSKYVSLPAPIALDNFWELRFDQESAKISRDTMQSLIPLNKSSVDKIKYFSGTTTYHQTFSLDKDVLQQKRRIFLQLGKVREIAEVFINGRRVGLTWHTPFQLDISDAIREGKNFLVVEVVNTINNMLVGNAKLPPEYRRTQSNITKLPNAWRQPFADAPLIDAGLIGPVKIVFGEIIIKSK